jgi:hypothetical protein
MKCPKCEFYGMAGPTYTELSNGFYSEALSYRCMRCGYVEYKPVANSKEGLLEKIQRNMAQRFDERHKEKTT